MNVRIARDPDLVRRTVRELVLNHHRWWDGTNRGGWFGDDRVERYLEEAAVLLARQGTFLGFALEVDGEAIAWNAGAFDGTRYFEQIISYDRARTDYSPGMLLENLVVKALIDLHAQGIELGPGFTELKHEIGGLPTEYGHLHGYRGWFRAIDAIHQTWVHKPVTP